MRGAWRLTKRRWRAWCARLRRDRAALALVALLSLGVFEPLACIIHCQIWIPFVLRSYFAAQHQHHPHSPSTIPGAAADVRSVAETPVFLAPPIAGSRWCFMDAGHGSSNQPFGVPPSPIHEMIPVLVLPLIAVLLMVARAVDPPGAPPHVAFPPPLRPPISFAA